ncbi:MAG: cell wall-binding repeat-containing protein [Euzebya sp.]
MPSAVPTSAIRIPIVLVLGVLALVLALLPAAPATAEAFPGGQFGHDAQSSKASASESGPIAPELDWLTELDGFTTPGGTVGELVFDSAGHVLYQGTHTVGDGTEDALAAVDRDDGQLAWSLDGIDRGCGVAADDDGRIYALSGTNPQADRALLAIDAATGAVAATWEPTVQDELALGGCSDSLRLAEDGTLISLGSADFAARMHAFDTSGDLLELLWTREYNEEGPGADDENTSELARPVVSADGTAVYVCAEVLARNRPDTDIDDLVLQKLDLATGDLVASLSIPQEGSRCETRGVIAVDGGVIVGTENPGFEYTMTRVDDVGTDLSIRWSQILSRDEALDESGIGNYPAASLSLSGNLVVFREAGFGIYHAIDADTGELRWNYRATAGHNSYENVAVDARGDMYIPVTGGDRGLESFDSDGNRRWVADLDQLHGRDNIFGAEFVTVGPDGRLYIRTVAAPGNVAVIAAIRNGVTRVAAPDADDVAELARQISQYLFPVDSARSVVLARDDVFADALAGAPLAGDHSPILYTTGGPDAPLDGDTRSEIGRVLPDGSTVRILGGENAVSTLVADELTDAGYVVERFAGASRVETAAKIAAVVVSEAVQGGAADTAVLAFAGNWPDAVTGGAWAAAAQAPILLTYTDELHPATAQALQDLGISDTLVLGGTAVISQQTADATPGADRISGANRMGTAAAVAEQLWPLLPDFEGSRGFVATNLDIPFGWAAALAASPVSARLTAPQLGVYADRYPNETAQLLAGLDLADGGLFAVGNESLIAADVIDQMLADVRR